MKILENIFSRNCFHILCIVVEYYTSCLQHYVTFCNWPVTNDVQMGLVISIRFIHVPQVINIVRQTYVYFIPLVSVVCTYRSIHIYYPAGHITTSILFPNFHYKLPLAYAYRETWNILASSNIYSGTAGRDRLVDCYLMLLYSNFSYIY